ncbi:MAG: hypothetical protein WED81_01870 [Rhodothermales bacterium]
MCYGVVLFVLATHLAGCAGTKNVEVPPDEQFGHRFETEGPEGRRTIDITQADSTGRYFYYPAAVDTVHIRPAPFSGDSAAVSAVPVEVLVKGALPDACSELHEVTQNRYGHLIEMRVEMRRPQGAVCASVVRPFRFYVRLEGVYEPGSYSVKLNDWVYTFSVRAPEAAG